MFMLMGKDPDLSLAVGWDFAFPTVPKRIKRRGVGEPRPQRVGRGTPTGAIFLGCLFIPAVITLVSKGQAEGEGREGKRRRKEG